MAFSIRRAVADDAQFVFDLFTMPHVRAFTKGPPTRDAFVAVLDRPDYVVLTVERDDAPFGHVVLRRLGGWLVELVMIAFAEQRTGAGRYAMERVLREVFVKERAHRLYLEVVAANVGARALYEAIGFCAEGCFRDGYRAQDGSFSDLIPYGLLASEYAERQQTG